MQRRCAVVVVAVGGRIGRRAKGGDGLGQAVAADLQVAVSLAAVGASVVMVAGLEAHCFTIGIL